MCCQLEWNAHGVAPSYYVDQSEYLPLIVVLPGACTAMGDGRKLLLLLIYRSFLSSLFLLYIHQDGRQLPMSGQMGNTLLVTGVGREDKGMYQCMVRRQEGDTFQAVAELQLGGKWAQDVGCVYVNSPEILN